MNRISVAGFMMGLGLGVVIGYFLKPHDETTVPLEMGHARDADSDMQRR